MCDLTIAAKSARLGEIQIRRLRIPMLITPYITGQKQAKEILLLGEMSRPRLTYVKSLWGEKTSRGSPIAEWQTLASAEDPFPTAP